MALNRSLVGKGYGTHPYEVTADAIASYARATNDPNERYLGGDVVASPIFPVVASFGDFMAAAMDPELGADLLRLVHAAEEHVLHRAVRPGDRLEISTVLETVTSGDDGDSFTVLSTQTGDDGEPVAEVRGTMSIRGTGARRRPTGHLVDKQERDIVFEQTTQIDEDQTRRYAEASGDANPIHLDEAVARSAGLPGVIVHGMCTLAVATKAAVDGPAGGDPERVARVKARFAKPVYPGQRLTTKLWRLSSADGVASYGFETYQAAGVAVIRDGEVEIAPG
jgi:acyl dehydratase